MTKKRITIITITAAILTIVTIFTFFILNLSKSARLEILVAPSTAKIIIDGKEYSNGTYSLKPSQINVTISLEGFVTKQTTLTLEANQTTKLYDFLEQPNGDLSWYLSHQSELMLLNSIGDALAIDNSNSFLKKYPIAEILPIIIAQYDKEWNYTEYRIDGGSFDDCAKDFCIKITDTTGGNYDAALDLIRQKNYNPEDYEIIYEYKPIVPLD